MAQPTSNGLKIRQTFTMCCFARVRGFGTSPLFLYKQAKLPCYTFFSPGSKLQKSSLKPHPDHLFSHVEMSFKRRKMLVPILCSNYRMVFQILAATYHVSLSFSHPRSGWGMFSKTWICSPDVSFPRIQIDSCFPIGNDAKTKQVEWV